MLVKAHHVILTKNMLLWINVVDKNSHSLKCALTSSRIILCVTSSRGPLMLSLYSSTARTKIERLFHLVTWGTRRFFVLFRRGVVEPSGIVAKLGSW